MLQIDVGTAESESALELAVPPEVASMAKADHQTALPTIARNPDLTAEIYQSVRQLSSNHRVYLGDSRKMVELDDESVHLVVTSPPYWNLKPYESSDGQLGLIDDYEEFVTELARVWAECFRVLVPGGRMVINVGDILLSRRVYGRHVVFPLHASIQESCRKIGFDNLAPIIWYKIGNAKFEAGGGGFLGKPYEPNAVIKNDIEYVMFQRKPGGYRSPTVAVRTLSVISAAEHREWFNQIWTLGGASTKNHPAPFPEAFAERLVRMFSFVGDTVLDPFVGSGTTSVVAKRWGRNSVGYEIEEEYLSQIRDRLESETFTPSLALGD